MSKGGRTSHPHKETYGVQQIRGCLTQRLQEGIIKKGGEGMWRFAIMLFTTAYAFSCPASISIEEAIRIAKPYVGEVHYSGKGQSKKRESATIE